MVLIEWHSFHLKLERPLNARFSKIFFHCRGRARKRHSFSRRLERSSLLYGVGYRRSRACHNWISELRRAREGARNLGSSAPWATRAHAWVPRSSNSDCAIVCNQRHSNDDSSLPVAAIEQLSLRQCSVLGLSRRVGARDQAATSAVCAVGFFWLWKWGTEKVPTRWSNLWRHCREASGQPRYNLITF